MAEDIKLAEETLNEENTTNESIDTNTEVSVDDLRSQYKLMTDLVKEVNDSYIQVKDHTNHVVNKMGYDSQILDFIIPYPIEDIDNMDITEIREFLSTYYLHQTESKLEDTSDEELRKDMKDIKEASLLLLNTKLECDKIRLQGTEIFNEYSNYLSSNLTRSSREERLKLMKEAYEKSTDESDKRKMKKMIDDIQSALDYAFVYERINKYGQTEIDNIIDGFFNDRHGLYIMDRFKSKIKAFGYKDEIIKHFFNIEENFLDESYHEFNNLFLYIYIRMVAYSDPYNTTDKLFVTSLTTGISNLIYHRFETTDTEDLFKVIICKLLDNFKSKSEYFKENNTSYKNNDIRKQREQDNEEQRKDVIIKALHKMKIDDFDESLPSSELRDIFQQNIDKMITEQNEKYIESRNSQNSDDGDLIIPHINTDDTDVESDVVIDSVDVGHDGDN